MSTNYFWNKVSGVNADLKRHNEARAELLARLATSTDPVFIAAYKNFLRLLEDSRVEVVDKIGRKNKKKG